MNTQQVGRCSVELKTTPAKPSIFHWLLGTAMLVFVSTMLLMTFLPYLESLSMAIFGG